MKTKLLASLALFAVAATAHADIRITEVAPWGSSSSTGYAADWFELTNTGSAAVSIAGWKMDDNSNNFAQSVALTGIASIGAGESVVFLEGDSSNVDAFKTAWFGSAAPAALQIGTYSGSGVGLSQSGDAVNIFTSTGTLVTRVDFGATSAFVTLDNAIGADNVTISTLSAAGVHGAFTSASGNQLGSPGLIAAVPEPSTYALLLAGLALVGTTARRRRG
jgi:hypothetical protein